MSRMATPAVTRELVSTEQAPLRPPKITAAGTLLWLLCGVAVTYAGAPEKGVRFVKPDPDHPKRAVCVWTVGEPEDARAWFAHCGYRCHQPE